MRRKEMVLRLNGHDTYITYIPEEDEDALEKFLHTRHMILTMLLDVYQDELTTQWTLSSKTKQDILIRRLKEHIYHMNPIGFMVIKNK